MSTYCVPRPAHTGLHRSLPKPCDRSHIFPILQMRKWRLREENSHGRRGSEPCYLGSQGPGLHPGPSGPSPWSYQPSAHPPPGSSGHLRLQSRRVGHQRPPPLPHCCVTLPSSGLLPAFSLPPLVIEEGHPHLHHWDDRTPCKLWQTMACDTEATQGGPLKLCSVHPQALTVTPKPLPRSLGGSRKVTGVPTVYAGRGPETSGAPRFQAPGRHLPPRPRHTPAATHLDRELPSPGALRVWLGPGPRPPGTGQGSSPPTSPLAHLLPQGGAFLTAFSLPR